jgi:uncharacterized protein (TIGR03067 family)
MRLACCTLLSLSLIAAAQENADPAKELKSLEGTWQVTAMEAFGKPAPADKAPKELVIAGNKLKGLGPDMDIKLDPAKKPRWIDLTFKKGDKSYPIKAIYDLSGDELRLCIPLAPVGAAFENKRLESFDTKDKPQALLRLKRAKP